MALTQAQELWVEALESGTYKQVEGHLHIARAQALGLSSKDGDFIDLNGCDTALIILNDNGKTFQEIAAIICSEPKGLFVTK